MNTRFFTLRRLDVTLRSFKRLIGVVLLMAYEILTLAQGTITFGTRLSPYSTTQYRESGVWFQVEFPVGSHGYDNMVILPPNWAQTVPQNPTAFMGWFRQFNPYDYVDLALTDGSPFGLSSVQLADPNSPSDSLLPITFIGYRSDGSTVSQTFITPGNGASSFLAYQFNSDFASGLLSVKIDASRWAMDNLVWVVPEPATVRVFLLGLLALGLARRRCRRPGAPAWPA